jgi:hypothetical protein
MFVKLALSVLPQDTEPLAYFSIYIHQFQHGGLAKIIMCDPRTTAGALLQVPKNVES